MLTSTRKFIFGTLTLLAIIIISLLINNSRAHTVWSSAAVTSLTWSPDGRTLAIGSADGIIILWDIPQNKMRQSIDAKSSIISLAWSPDSSVIASGIWSETDQNAVTLWDSNSGVELRTIGVPTPRLRALSWEPGGVRLSAGLQESAVLLWDIVNDNVQEITGLSDEVLTVAWSPDSRLLAVSQQDGFVAFLDPFNYETVQRVEFSPSYYIADIGWSPDSQTLASAPCFTEADLTANCFIALWKQPDDEYAQAFQGGRYEFSSIAWSPTGKFIASGFSNGDVTLYNPDNGSRIRTFRTPVGSTIVTWAPDGRTLAAGSEDGSVLLWTIH